MNRSTRFSLALAPMEGVTDAVFRDVVTALGDVDWCVTEFLRVTDRPIPPGVVRKHCPELLHGGRTRNGTPVHVQLLGGDADVMAESARIAASCGATTIDLNFGCPAPTVNRHDGGATLLKDPRRVEQVTASVRAALPASITVSAKVRLGWDDPDAIESIARAAEAGGAAWITVHGRTRQQGYAPSADWERIGRAARAVSVPVVANGDLNAPEDLERCHAVTGCDRFMLGRGAIARPELFRWIRGNESRAWEPEQRIALMQRFARTSLQGEGDRERVTLARMKQWTRAMAAAEPRIVPFFDRLKRITAMPEALALLDGWNGHSGKHESEARA